MFKPALVLSLIALVLFSGCSSPSSSPSSGSSGSAENKVASVDLLDRNFVRDSKGAPVEIKLVGKVKLQGVAVSEQEFACDLKYSDQFVNQDITKKEKLAENGEKEVSVTMTAPLNGKLDIGKWSVCCGLGKSLDKESQKVVCTK